MRKYIRHIIISRTDSIGDVVLTLPLAKVIKNHYPDVYISFLAKKYTKPVIECCEFVDNFIDVEDFLQENFFSTIEKPDAIIHVFPVKTIAKKARSLQIPLRIGTTNRMYHWSTCNKLIRLSRKNSSLHEAELNLKLLKGLGILTTYTRKDIPVLYGFNRIPSLPQKFENLIDTTKTAVILHPKSQGSAREWGIKNFIELIRLLDTRRFQIFISGTKAERSLMDDLFEKAGDRITDITGWMHLSEFISFINKTHVLVANSTGPLHIAAALGKHALGIYPPIKPMHPGRWAPIGTMAQYFVVDKNCIACKNLQQPCSCIQEVSPQTIATAIQKIAPF